MWRVRMLAGRLVMSNSTLVIEPEAVWAARQALEGVVRRTPLWRPEGLCAVVGVPDLWLKMENMQHTGSFKIRGASYKISRLSNEERARGVVAASAGNHAQGVALAAQQAGIQATIYMPAQASVAKVEATLGYGARVILEGHDFDEAVEAARLYTQKSGAVWVSAFDDPDIIAGQGTLGLEITDELPDVDTIIIPVGGGGLLAGVATAIKSVRPCCRVVGVQTRAFDVAVRSWKAKVLEVAPASRSVDEKNFYTIADGIAVKSPSQRTFAHLLRYADDMVTVTDESIAEAMRLLLTRVKTVAEPSGAAGLAALLEQPQLASGRTVVLICGGNVDSALLADILTRGLTRSGRVMWVQATVLDRPGALAVLLSAVGNAGANVLEVHHDRRRPGLQPGDTGVELLIEGRNLEHLQTVQHEIQAHNTKRS